MNKYKYDDSPIQIGDIVEVTNGYPEHDRPKGSLAIVEELHGSLVLISDKRGSRQEWSKHFIKKVLTKSGHTAKQGDSIIFINETDGGATKEKVYICIKASVGDGKLYIHFDDTKNKEAKKFKVLVKENNILAAEFKVYDEQFIQKEVERLVNAKEFINQINKSIQKENKMDTVEIKVNGKAINLGNEEPETLKTELEVASKTITEWYNEEGNLKLTTKQTKKQAKKDLQLAGRLAWTFITYTRSGSATTDIPVKEL